MSPLKPPQPCGRYVAWCFVNAPCHLISTTFWGGNRYPVNLSLGFHGSQSLSPSSAPQPPGEYQYAPLSQFGEES